MQQARPAMRSGVRRCLHVLRLSFPATQTSINKGLTTHLLALDQPQALQLCEARQQVVVTERLPAALVQDQAPQVGQIADLREGSAIVWQVARPSWLRLRTKCRPRTTLKVPALTPLNIGAAGLRSKPSGSLQRPKVDGAQCPPQWPMTTSQWPGDHLRLLPGGVCAALTCSGESSCQKSACSEMRRCVRLGGSGFGSWCPRSIQPTSSCS